MLQLQKKTDLTHHVMKTIYIKGWSFFTLSQLVRETQTEKGNTSRILKKLLQQGVLSKVDDSAVYCIDREDLTIKALFSMIQIQNLDLGYQCDTHLFLKYESFFRGQHLQRMRVEGVPFYLSVICEAEQKIEPRKRNCHHRTIPYVLEGDHIDRWLSSDDMQVSLHVLESEAKLKTSHALSRWIRTDRKEDREQFHQMSDSFSKDLLQEMSLKTLTHHLHEYIRTYISAMSRCSVMESCRFVVIPEVVRRVQDHMKETGNGLQAYESNEVLGLLTGVTNPTYINDAHHALTDLVNDLESESGFFQELMSKQIPEYDDLQYKKPKVYDRLETYRHSYRDGISFAGAKFISGNELLKRLCAMYGQENTSKVGPRSMHTYKKNRTRREMFLKTIACTGELAYMVEYVEDMIQLKDESTRMVMSFHYRGDVMLTRLATLLECSLDSLTYMSYDEVLLTAHGLMNIDPDQLQERRQFSLCLQKEDKYCFMTGNHGRETLGILTRDIHQSFAGMRGRVLTSGIAVGPVKCISKKTDLSIVAPGDIVAMTNFSLSNGNGLHGIKALLIESGEVSEKLTERIRTHSGIPVITHVHNLLHNICSGCVLHIDGDFGRILVLEDDLGS